MRIAHVVTLVSPDGAFGGPVRVAAHLARATREAGHEVTILGAYRGYDRAPSDIDGVPAKLFPARQLLPGLGFSGLVAPGLRRYLRRHITDFDVIHVHLARDLVTLPVAWAARRRGVRYVLQPHGMVDASTRLLAKVLDAVATRKVLRGATTVFHLTGREKADLVGVARTADLPLTFLPNGVPVSDLTADVDSGHEVLFLSRLQARKRPAIFVEAALVLRERFPGTRFTLVGPDEGEAAKITARIAAAGAGDTVVWEGPLPPDKTLERMSRASLYVLPSVHEPFPMTVLEAMSVGLPSIVTDTCALVGELSDPGAVSVVDDSLDGLVAEMDRLLRSREERRNLGDRGRREVEQHLSVQMAAQRAIAGYVESAPVRR